MPGKDRRWGRKTVRRAAKLKKAVVTLRPGDTLDVFGA
jgi:ribosomal protein L23